MAKKSGSGLTETPFKDAICTPKGLSSPAPSQNNKSGKK
jgi:hypothetical protein